MAWWTQHACQWDDERAERHEKLEQKEAFDASLCSKNQKGVGAGHAALGGTELLQYYGNVGGLGKSLQVRVFEASSLVIGLFGYDSGA